MQQTAGTMADDEFRFLASDAERVRRSRRLPEVSRVRADAREGRRVSGLRFGAPADPELVALHGAGLNAHSFDPMLLAADVPALALDLPGHGRSDWRADADYRPQHLAPDVAAAVEILTRGPVSLLGHSLGGLTAALVAARLPSRVARLWIVDITPGITPSSDAGAVAAFITGQRHYATVDEIVDRAIRFGIGSDRAALTRGVSLNTRRRPDGRIEWTHHLAHLDALPAAGGGARPYAEIWDALQSLEIPVSLIRADSGMLNDALVEEWRRRLPRAEVITLAGPHNLHEAAPTELAEAVRRSSR